MAPTQPTTTNKSSNPYESLLESTEPATLSPPVTKLFHDNPDLKKQLRYFYLELKRPRPPRAAAPKFGRKDQLREGRQEPWGEAAVLQWLKEADERGKLLDGAPLQGKKKQAVMEQDAEEGGDSLRAFANLVEAACTPETGREAEAVNELRHENNLGA
ncbi:MAG: hypothetical protein Q9159_003306 [Coniocarpon cinnabarinum]